MTRRTRRDGGRDIGTRGGGALAHLGILLAAAGAAAAAAPAGASSTHEWVVASREGFDRGDLHDVILSSMGEISLSRATTKIESEEIAIWSQVVDGEGRLWLGTGNRGVVARLEGEAIQKVYDTEQLVVTALAVGADGAIYAGTIPEGKVFRIEPDGKGAEFCQLDGKYVWALVAHPDGNLYAGTGEDGKLFRIAPDGTPEVLFDSDEDHILSLAVGDGGEIYCGTGMGGLLYRVTTGGAVSVLHDFPHNEVRALVWHEGDLYAACNMAKRFKARDFVKRLKRAVEKEAEAKEPESAFQELFDGAVFRMHEGGGMVPLFEFEKHYVVSIAVDGERNLFVATGDEGKVYRVLPSEIHYTLFDLEENQGMTLLVRDGKLRWIGTGNAGVLYRLDEAPAEEGRYVSEVKDLGFRSRFGTLRWLGEGGLGFETRSGNTSVPDDTWSSWQRVTDGASKVASPAGRFLQFRALWDGDAEALLRSVAIAYRPENQRPRFQSFSVETRESGGGLEPPTNPKELELSWRASDPDDDELVYRLGAHLEGQDAWIDLTPREPLTKDKVKLSTESFQDGWYRFRVVASDEGQNDAASALENERVSTPVLIDNRKPEVLDLRVEGDGESGAAGAAGGAGGTGASRVVTGRARDASGRIQLLQFSLDGGTWRIALPDDGLFDDLEETFRVELSGLDAGEHTITVRAFDAAGNVEAAFAGFAVE